MNLRTRSLSGISYALLAAVLLTPAWSYAQATPPAAAAAHTETATLPAADALDALTWNAGLGGSFAYGNSRAFALNANTAFNVRRNVHQFDANAVFNWGLNSTRAMGMTTYGPWNDNVLNVNAKFRYDYYLMRNLAIFGSVVGRHDRFANLDFRFQAQAGLRYNVINEEKQILYGEFGYDFSYDVITQPNVRPNQSVHSLLAGFGYDNHVSDNITYLMAFQYLQPLGQSPGDSPDGSTRYDDVRLKWTNELRIKIEERFQVGLTWNLLVDFVPVAGAQEADFTSAVNLLYTLM